MRDGHTAAVPQQNHAASGEDQDVIASESTPNIGALGVLALLIASLSQQARSLRAGSEYTPAVQFPPGLLVRVATPPPRCASL